MSEKDTPVSETKPNSEAETAKEIDISRYFENVSHTIFDDIVPPKNEFAFEISNEDNSSGFETDPECSTNYVSNLNTLISNERDAGEPTNSTYRDIWIPSKQTRKVLQAIVTSTTGNNHLDKENLTVPVFAIQSDMPDEIQNAASHFLGEDENIHRNVLTAFDVTQDERGLRNLIQAGCYKAAINLSSKLLAVYTQNYGKINQPSKHTPHSLQLWYTRLALLVKLKQIDILEKESKPFGDLDKPDMFFAFYPELYGIRPGSMATFAFRLLLAEVPMYCGKPQQALDNLYKILATVNKIILNLSAEKITDSSYIKINVAEKEDALQLWKGRRFRVLISIANSAISIKNFVLAIDVLQIVYKSSGWTEEQLDALRSSIGRLHLLLGDVSAAEKLLINVNKGNDTLTVRELVDKGLMAVAQNSFQEAYKCFQIASTIEPSNVTVINNLGVCLLYTGQLKAAVQLYENSITRNPLRSLQECLILNMCTSYELHRTHCRQTKLNLLRQLNRYKGDAIDIQCLKLVP